MIDFSHLLKMDLLIQSYLLFKLMDFITGFLKAFKSEGFRSSKIRSGVINTIGEIVAIAFSGILDQVLGINMLLMATKLLFIYKECISIVENLGILGVELPSQLKNQIQVLKDKDSQNKGGENNG